MPYLITGCFWDCDLDRNECCNDVPDGPSYSLSFALQPQLTNENSFPPLCELDFIPCRVSSSFSGGLISDSFNSLPVISPVPAALSTETCTNLFVPSPVRVKPLMLFAGYCPIMWRWVARILFLFTFAVRHWTYPRPSTPTYGTAGNLAPDKQEPTSV